MPLYAAATEKDELRRGVDAEALDENRAKHQDLALHRRTEAGDLAGGHEGSKPVFGGDRLVGAGDGYEYDVRQLTRGTEDGGDQAGP